MSGWLDHVRLPRRGPPVATKLNRQLLRQDFHLQERAAFARRTYNPKKPGRPSHHPLVAFARETGDCLGVRWRPGNAHTAAGAEPWIETIVARLRELGVAEITVRLDKGFFAHDMVLTLERLGVGYLLKLPAHGFIEAAAGRFRVSEKDPWIETASGSLWGARLLAVRGWRPVIETAGQGELLPEDRELETCAYLLTNIPGIQALTAWRRYNRGAVVEQRIDELAQLGVGRTAIDDRGGNALLWALGAVAYELFHIVRRDLLAGVWRTAQPHRLRRWLFRLPATFTRTARKDYLQLRPDEPLRPRLLAALRAAGQLGPPVPA